MNWGKFMHKNNNMSDAERLLILKNTSIAENLFLFPTNHEETPKLIKNLKPKTSYGLDGISNELLKSIYESIKEPIFTILNKSLRDGAFPKAWKTSKVKLLL